MKWFDPTGMHADDLRWNKSIWRNLNYHLLARDSLRPALIARVDRRHNNFIFQSFSVRPAFGRKRPRASACKLRAASTNAA